VAVDNATDELNKTTQVNTREVAVIKTPQTTADSQPWTVNREPLTVDSLATITLVEQKPPYMKYESQSASNGVAVFSEVFYPKGWHAFMDGKEVPILRANYILRAIEVPAGKHTIEFKFEPKPYTVGNNVTMASGWILLIVVLGSLAASLKSSDLES
jgi:uncharacterized membrane protein YfhO